MGMKKSLYRHGGFRAADFGRLDIGERPVLDFSVNLNPLGPPPLIMERWGALIQGIRDYPSVEGEGISLYYEQRYAIPPDQFLAGNGSTEMIYLIPRALGFNTALVITPSFHDYSRASLVAGVSIRHHSLSFNGETFGLSDRVEVADRMREADALWLGNPNNPTGNLHPREMIMEICRRHPKKWVIVDEAFISFVENRDLFSFLGVKRPKNLLVLYSLTKFYALAGIRMGGVVASPEVIRRLKSLKEPWTVNGIAERIAPLLLECGDYEQKTLSLIQKERTRLFHSLRAMEGLLVSSPSANFVLCKWLRTEDLDDLLRHLLSAGIYVRDCRNFHGLEGNWFRVAVKRPEENDRLLSAITSFSGRHV